MVRNVIFYNFTDVILLLTNIINLIGNILDDSGIEPHIPSNIGFHSIDMNMKHIDLYLTERKQLPIYSFFYSISGIISRRSTYLMIYISIHYIIYVYEYLFN